MYDVRFSSHSLIQGKILGAPLNLKYLIFYWTNPLDSELPG